MATKSNKYELKKLTKKQKQQQWVNALSNNPWADNEYNEFCNGLDDDNVDNRNIMFILYGTR